MNFAEKKMVKILSELKESGIVSGLKTEFETEGARYEEALKLKDISARAGLDFTIKIGGCEAVRDMYDAKNIGADIVVAPMIETTYAMKKYVKAIKRVFGTEENHSTKFLMNIETYTGFINLKSMIESELFDFIDGVVTGRADMAGSMGLSNEETESETILNIAASISRDLQNTGKIMIIGGGICAKSLEFLDKIPYLTGFETRKVVFESNKNFDKSIYINALNKAIEFEILWLKYKNSLYNGFAKECEERVKILESRFYGSEVSST